MTAATGSGKGGSGKGVRNRYSGVGTDAGGSPGEGGAVWGGVQHGGAVGSRLCAVSRESRWSRARTRVGPPGASSLAPQAPAGVESRESRVQSRRPRVESREPERGISDLELRAAFCCPELKTEHGTLKTRAIRRPTSGPPRESAQYAQSDEQLLLISQRLVRYNRGGQWSVVRGYWLVAGRSEPKEPAEDPHGFRPYQNGNAQRNRGFRSVRDKTTRHRTSGASETPITRDKLGT